MYELQCVIMIQLLELLPRFREAVIESLRELFCHSDGFLDVLSLRELVEPDLM